MDVHKRAKELGYKIGSSLIQEMDMRRLYICRESAF